MKTNLRSCITLSVLMLVAGGVFAEEKGQTEITPAVKPSDYVFKVIKIEPSPEDGYYTGHFQFINRRSKDVLVVGFDKPVHEKFSPGFLGFETMVDGSWKYLKISCDGLGLESLAMKSMVPYELIFNLSLLEEQEAPLTARIRLDDDIVSEPFVLNWKKDRADGAFAAAKKRHIEEVRAAFIKAGFKPELLKGDDFCERLLCSIVRATESDRKYGFDEFKGKLDVTPDIELNGNIRLVFTSVDSLIPSLYSGTWVINPDKFNSKWFKRTARKHVKAETKLIYCKMELNDGSSEFETDVRLFFEINYCPPNLSGGLPTEEKAQQRFLKMLDNLESWLK